ncbi:MAG: serine hydrolase domain-containing protein [Bacteroidales bacterium]
MALLVILLFQACNSEVEEKEYPAEVLSRIDSVEKNLAGWVVVKDESRWTLQQRMHDYRIKGLCIAVIRDYKIEWIKGYGLADSAENRPVDLNTLFQAASISKTINSMGIMRLVQEGRLDLDADINKYLRTWKSPFDTITTAQLLSHTAGLSQHGFPGYLRGVSLPDITQILNGEPPADTKAVVPLARPGQRVIYSGGGVTISQLLLTDITGQPYDRWMKREVLDPLGMKSSFYTQPPPASSFKNLATGYKPDGSEVPGKYHVYPELAAAGLWTNPGDLARYIIETQLCYNGKSEKVISTELMKKRLTPVIDNAALGVFIVKRGSGTWFLHDGGNEGFTCMAIGSLDSGDGAVIMTNSDNGSIMDEVINSVATVYAWKDYYVPQERTPVSISSEKLLKFIGEYDLGGGSAEIKQGDDGLILDVYGMGWKMFFTSDSTFFVKEYNSDLKFGFRKDGSVSSIIMNGMIFRKFK